ncbi:syntaxin-7-like isoform X2 [Pomacea canaliculata]|uniref:syntaxin-7-like isoform X2 n=1 Tax=Pomacea canaliculata TaxID=400727 RepID=UPI000D727655|nr:syntaxin-7-like isoform X2 [Pomacea canaliculata]
MASYGRGSFEGFDSYQGTSASRESGTDFGRLSQNISANIQKITQNVAQIQRLVVQIGTPQDSEENRQRVHQTTHYTNQLAKETNNFLKQLAHLPLPTSASEQRQWKMQKERLTDEFSTVLTNFQTAQRTAAEKERASVQRARAYSGLNQSPFEDTEQKGDRMGAPGYSQTREVLQMEQDVDLELLREREDAIKKLERDIMDVNTIFKDLGMLVHEQGEVLDSIEANIDNAQMSVQEGTQQLSKAREYQKKSRRKMCILLLIFIIAVTILALVIWGATK